MLRLVTRCHVTLTTPEVAEERTAWVSPTQSDEPPGLLAAEGVQRRRDTRQRTAPAPDAGPPGRLHEPRLLARDNHRDIGCAANGIRTSALVQGIDQSGGSNLPPCLERGRYDLLAQRASRGTRLSTSPRRFRVPASQTRILTPRRPDGARYVGLLYANTQLDSDSRSIACVWSAVLVRTRLVCVLPMRMARHRR